MEDFAHPPETVAALRAEIEARLAGSEAESATTAADRAPVALDQQSVGRLSRMDAIERQAMAAAAERRRAAERARLKAALQRMREGEYGWCEECGEAIPLPRLRADPAARLCAACATAAR